MAAIDQQDQSIMDLRRKTLLVLLVGVFTVLSVRLFYLQVIRNDYYNRLALSNRIQRERIIAPRGLIRARDGSKLVVNVPAYQIIIQPGEIAKREDRLRLACDWLDIDQERLTKNLADWEKKYDDGRDMTVVQSADKHQISILMENRDIFGFFRLVMKHRRQYPEGAAAAHLLGYVGEVTDEDIRDSGELHPGDIIGRAGVENWYEGYLRGRDGVRIVEISAGGTQIGELVELIDDESGEEIIGSRSPIPGNDVYLTIDLDLQLAVERIFDWQKGSVIVMNPHSGEILAAVSRPGYDPNIFLTGVSEEQWRELYDNPSKPLFNRTVQATYPPGSVFKLITAYTAVNNSIAPRGRSLKPCWGGYQFGNRYFRCWKPEGHGALSLYGAIVQSCDVFFYQLGEMLTADQFAAAGRAFGFGRKTGVDLPGEVNGTLPDHAYFDRRFGKRKWTKGHLLNYSIGQGELLTTPVQLCTMVAVFANGGYRIRPYVVDRIVDVEGRTVHETDAASTLVRRVDNEAIELIKRSLRGVVSDEKGTGRAASLPEVRIAGKTGTSQNPHGDDHALFVAYAPSNSPEIVLTIVMENAGHGGAAAAPLARRIFSAYFHSVAGWDGGFLYIDLASAAGCGEGVEGHTGVGRTCGTPGSRPPF